jgi:hypothetical protein
MKFDIRTASAAAVATRVKKVMELTADNAPCELQCGIRKYWESEEWNNAARISWLESDWDAFAVRDTTDAMHSCGARLDSALSIPIYAERSISYFQINSCNFPGWEWQRLYNADHNCGTAHLIWTQQGWGAWYFSAKALGLI